MTEYIVNKYYYIFVHVLRMFNIIVIIYFNECTFRKQNIRLFITSSSDKSITFVASWIFIK